LDKLVIIRRGFSLSQLLKNLKQHYFFMFKRKENKEIFFSSPKYEPGYFSAETVHQKSPVKSDPVPLE